ncbi:MAG: hypothetical protein QW717_06745 [Candidatus Bathyarchaeia archaeon]
MSLSVTGLSLLRKSVSHAQGEILARLNIGPSNVDLFRGVDGLLEALETYGLVDYRVGVGGFVQFS